MPDGERSISLENALDRYWDTILAGASTAPDVDLDPGLAATAQRVHALDTATSPHPAFASTLWEDLMHAHTLSPAIVAQPSARLHVRPMQDSGRWIAPAPSQPMSRIAAAILLIALLAGSAFAALYPLRQREGGGLPIFAPLATPAVDADSAAATILVNLMLTDISGFPNEGGMAVTDYPPGGSSIELAGKESPEVFYIATGPMTMRVEEAVDPVRVIPPGEEGSAAPERLLAAGQETTLVTGTTVVSPERAIVELRNEEAVATKMLDLLWATESYSTESGGANWGRGTGMSPQELVFPVAIVLRQLTLAPEGILPAPDFVDTVQAAAPLDPSQRFDLRYQSDDSILNAGTQPVDLYHLTVTNNAGTVTAAQSIATPDAASELQFLWRSTGGPDSIEQAYGLGIDPEGNVWVAEGANDRFQIIAPDGTYRETWGTPGSGDGELEFLSTASAYGRAYGDVAFDSKGNFYVADTGNFRVQKFAPDRSFLRAWGSQGKEVGQFLAPSSIAIGADGVVYVSDEARGDVQMFDPDGQYLGVIGEKGTEDGQFNVPAGVTIDDAGDVWVADWGSRRIQRFTSAGDWLDTWGQSGSGDGALRNPNDVAVDDLGRVYVASDLSNELHAFSSDGQFLATIGGNGSDPGEFSDPLGVAVGKDGVVYVSDLNGVQAFRLGLP